MHACMHSVVDSLGLCRSIQAAACSLCGPSCAWDEESEWAERWAGWDKRLSYYDRSLGPIYDEWCVRLKRPAPACMHACRRRTQLCISGHSTNALSMERSTPASALHGAHRLLGCCSHAHSREASGMAWHARRYEDIANAGQLDEDTAPMEDDPPGPDRLPGLDADVERQMASAR